MESFKRNSFSLFKKFLFNPFRQQFPVYFIFQWTLSLLLAVSFSKLTEYPLENLYKITRFPSLIEWNLILLLGSFCSASLNYWYVGPESTRIMFQRHELEKKKTRIPPALNRSFSLLHGISSLLNLVTLGACLMQTVWIASLIK